MGLHARTAPATRSAGRSGEPAPHEILQRILVVDGDQPSDWPAATRDDELGPLLNPLEMLAQTIVKLPNPDLVVLAV